MLVSTSATRLCFIRRWCVQPSVQENFLDANIHVLYLAEGHVHRVRFLSRTSPSHVGILPTIWPVTKPRIRTRSFADAAPSKQSLGVAISLMLLASLMSQTPSSNAHRSANKAYLVDTSVLRSVTNAGCHLHHERMAASTFSAGACVNADSTLVRIPAQSSAMWEPNVVSVTNHVSYDVSTQVVPRNVQKPVHHAQHNVPGTASIVGSATCPVLLLATFYPAPSVVKRIYNAVIDVLRFVVSVVQISDFANDAQNQKSSKRLWIWFVWRRTNRLSLIQTQLYSSHVVISIAWTRLMD